MTKNVIFHVTFMASLTAILLHIVIVFVNVAHHISTGTVCAAHVMERWQKICHFNSCSLVAHITLRFIVCQ